MKGISKHFSLVSGDFRSYQEVMAPFRGFPGVFKWSQELLWELQGGCKKGFSRRFSEFNLSTVSITHNTTALSSPSVKFKEQTRGVMGTFKTYLEVSEGKF